MLDEEAAKKQGLMRWGRDDYLPILVGQPADEADKA